MREYPAQEKLNRYHSATLDESKFPRLQPTMHDGGNTSSLVAHVLNVNEVTGRVASHSGI